MRTLDVVWRHLPGAQAPLYAHPVVDGNRVFIQDQAGVTAFTVE